MAGKLFSTCLAVVLVVASSVAFAESWLTPSEQELFAALGVNARVGDKAVQRPPRYATLSEIGQRAPEPLKSRILAMAGEFSHLTISPEEKQEIVTLAEKTGQMYRDHLRLALAGGETPEQVASAMAKKDGPYRELSRKYTQWVAREVQARETIAKNLGAITADLEKRSGAARPEADLHLEIAAAGPTMRLTGKAGAKPVESAVLQVTMHKDKADIGPVIDLLASAWLVDKGVDNILPSLEKLDPGVAAESAASTAIKTKSFNMPLVKTYGLPRIAPGQEVTIDLDEDLNDVIFFERLSLKVWTAEGTISVDEVPGLAAARKYREHAPRDELFREPAGEGENAAQPAPIFHPTAAASARSSEVPSENDKPAKRELDPPLTSRQNRPTGSGRAFGEPREDAARPSRSEATGKERRGFGQPAEKPAANPFNPSFGQPGASQGSDKPLTREQSRQKAQQEARNEKAALTALAQGKQAIGRKDKVLARGFLGQAITLAPESPAARQAKRLLEGLDK